MPILELSLFCACHAFLLDRLSAIADGRLAEALAPKPRGAGPRAAAELTLQSGEAQT